MASQNLVIFSLYYSTNVTNSTTDLFKYFICRWVHSNNVKIVARIAMNYIYDVGAISVNVIT